MKLFSAGTLVWYSSLFWLGDELPQKAVITKSESADHIEILVNEKIVVCIQDELAPVNDKNIDDHNWIHEWGQPEA